MSTTPDIAGRDIGSFRDLPLYEETVEAFQPWPKIGRLNRDMVVTEKIDGTNAAVVVGSTGRVWAQSRTKAITPENDNFGFARWVADHADELRELGEGRHFGEWWGKGIQRGYGLEERRFSLFNVNRWTSWHNSGENLADLPDWDQYRHQCHEVPCCYVVPVLDRHTFSTEHVSNLFDELKTFGSVAAPGFDNPEGVVVYHTAAGVMFKLNDAKEAP